MAHAAAAREQAGRELTDTIRKRMLAVKLHAARRWQGTRLRWNVACPRCAAALDRRGDEARQGAPLGAGEHHIGCGRSTKLYRTVAEQSLAPWLDGNCEPCAGTGVVQSETCNACNGTAAAPLTMAAGFTLEHTLYMLSELHNSAGSHAARRSQVAAGGVSRNNYANC